MSFYSLKRVQTLPISVSEAWDFFSNPENLEKITPAKMGFKITSDRALIKPMYPGQVITYIVTPLLGILLAWMTEIKHVNHEKLFVDEQRVGPYALWYHQHHFRAVPGGTEMTDLVHYQLPLGILGQLAHWVFVKAELARIFDYRYKVLETYFAK